MTHWTESFYYRSANNEDLNPGELSQVWDSANTAMHTGDYQAAYIAVETLLMQAQRGNVVKDYLCNPVNTKCCNNRTTEQCQGLIDRVESLNFYIRTEHRKTA